MFGAGIARLTSKLANIASDMWLLHAEIASKNVYARLARHNLTITPCLSVVLFFN